MSSVSLSKKVLLGLMGVLKPCKGCQGIRSDCSLRLKQWPANLSLLPLIVELVGGMLPYGSFYVG